MKLKIVYFFTLLLFFTITSYAKSVDTVMVPIFFEGNNVVSTSELEEVVGVVKPPFYAFWKDKRPKINSVLQGKLKETYTLFYKNEGFYDANITTAFTQKGIVIHIEENRPIIISSIEIKSDLNLSKAMLLHEGERFRAKEFTQTKRNIKKLLLSKGYCSPELSTKAYLDLEKYSADIKIHLAKRKVCHFGEITIETKSKDMQDDVILSRLHFKKGDVFNIEKIQESYESLYALEAFDQLNLDYSRNLYNEKPVKITYKEISKHIHTRVGVGYATDLKFQAKLYAEYKNYHGNGKKLVLDGLFSSKQKIIENRFFVPYVLDINGYHLDFQNSVGYSEEEGIHPFDEKNLYERLYFSHSSSEWVQSLGMGFERIETFNSINNDQINFLIYPFMRIVYDGRDSKLNPKKGIYFAHEMEYGLPYKVEATSYLKYLEELRLIYTLSDVTFSSVGRVGSMEVYRNNMPESKKFFAGGAFSNRAYGYDRIGITESTRSVSNLGGFTLANLSFEANFPIYKSFGGAIFNDNTMISDNQGIWEFSNNVISSVGIGFRYLTPIGPFKIDMGVNIHNKDERAVHFQVGQSF